MQQLKRVSTAMLLDLEDKVRNFNETFLKFKRLKIENIKSCDD